MDANQLELDFSENLRNALKGLVYEPFIGNCGYCLRGILKSDKYLTNADQNGVFLLHEDCAPKYDKEIALAQNRSGSR